LSGPAVKPLTLRAIADVARALPRMPLLASGGISTSVDAIEALIAGASAVQVGVAAMIDPTAPVTIAQGIAAELKRRSLLSPMQLRRALRTAEADA
jgi:dihydroorotate dehydrogenase (NAD+) catalytic subunit